VRALGPAALGLAAFVVAAALHAPAAADDERWVRVGRAAASPRTPGLALASLLTDAGVRADAPVRLRLRGTITDGIDGAEIDALGRRLGGLDAPSERWVVRPAGAREIERDPAGHTVTLEVPPGAALQVGIDVGALAASHLVTASEMRARLDGAIEVEVLVPASALPAEMPAEVPAEMPAEVPAHAPARAAATSSPLVPYGGGALVLGLGLALARWRRFLAPGRALLDRARRAHTALVRDARRLGPQFEGVIGPADALLEGARRSSQHLVEIERALRDTAFVESAAAAARLDALRAERASALRRLEDGVSGLEEAVVRLAHSRADRAAVTDLAAVLGRLGDEITIGREVDAELR
jgi:hypothetical protein